MTSTLAGNHDEVAQRIRKACERAGRPVEAVTLVAVTKFHSANAVRDLAQAGAKHFAESRVQEAQNKVPGLNSLGTWHFIGHLQTNKAKACVELFDVVQSVDSLRLAEKLSEAALGLGKTLQAYAQVNISLESQKHGFAPDGEEGLISQLSRLPGLKLTGLMGMAAMDDDPGRTRADFQRLRRLRDRLSPDLGPLALSMGMSQDFEIAIEEGADLVRVGSALFQGCTD